MNVNVRTFRVLLVITVVYNQVVREDIKLCIKPTKTLTQTWALRARYDCRKTARKSRTKRAKYSTVAAQCSRTEVQCDEPAKEEVSALLRHVGARAEVRHLRRRFDRVQVHAVLLNGFHQLHSSVDVLAHLRTHAAHKITTVTSELAIQHDVTGHTPLQT